MPFFNPFKRAQTYEDLMTTVGQVHKEIAQLPNAQRFDPKARAQQKLMIPGEVLEQYNNMNMFGTTPQGVPIRGVLGARGANKDAGMRSIKAGHLPSEGHLMLFPENALPANLEEASLPRTAPHLFFSPSYTGDPSTMKMTGEIGRRMADNARRVPGVRDPQMYDINAMEVKPQSFATNWWTDLPSKGKELYGALYDLIRAGGQGNTANTLTDINIARRLGNVGSHAIGHGDFGFITPVNEKMYSGDTEGWSNQLFTKPVRRRNLSDEFAYLHSVLGDKHAQSAQALSPGQLIDFNPDAQLGTLMTREGQLSGVYGPRDMRTPTGERLGLIEPHDQGTLRNLAAPWIQRGSGGVESAIGPATMGRQITTEAAIAGAREGKTAQEIAAELIGNADPSGFMNRYARGGLVAAHG